ncbi:PD40 domain-containing protein [Armatimonas rosea]|uniref:WD40 repeat protein n=1 Tax=Armatimonas rosea TaxID=685828 RepID=A0A7W9W7T4_ARMRO|nr:PD40 domain-containing protein [Armatimonas rosea]MBB6051420.1 WD40 repeat protein [Armatimonas rosea]
MKKLLVTALALSVASTAFAQARGREEKKQEEKPTKTETRSREETKQRDDRNDRRDDRDRRDSGGLRDIIILTNPIPRWPDSRWPRQDYDRLHVPRLTFVRDGVGLCTTGEAGQEPLVLRRNITLGAQSPARAPRKGRLAYVAPVNNQLALFTIADNLTRSHQLTDPKWGDADLPTWSPDDNTIAFVSHRDGNDELYTVSAGGGRPQRLTNHPGRDTQPAWSPGGKWIVFVSDRGGKPALWRIPAQGGNPTALEACPPGIPSDPTFSPDGRFLVASFEEAPGKKHLWKVDLDAKEEPRRLTTEPGDYRHPTFRPDGGKLVMSVRTASGGYALALLDFSANGLQQLTPGTLSDHSPVWW